MIVKATELANESKSILDREVIVGEIAEVQRQGKTVAAIQTCAGVSRLELVRILNDRGFSGDDSQSLKAAMDSASEVVGFSGGN